MAINKKKKTIPNPISRLIFEQIKRLVFIQAAT